MVDLSKNRCPLPCTWVFRLKQTSNSSSSKYKARIAAKGFWQEHNVVFDEIFSLCRENDNPSVLTWSSCYRGLGASLTRYQNGFRLGGNIYGVAESFHIPWPRTSSMPTQEESIRPQTGTATMVQEVRRLYPIDRLLKKRWGPLSLYENSSRWITHLPHHLRGRHANFWTPRGRTCRPHSATAVEVCHEGPWSGKTHTWNED